MAEPITTLGIGAIAAYLGKDGLEKLLGPTAEYLGGGLRDLAQKRVETIARIFQTAQRRLGDRVDQAGTVPPKVLKSVLDEGSFASQDIEVEYFGGILASSRTESGRDDRGARLSKLIDRLSSYQLRSHYLIYSTIRAAFSNRNLSMSFHSRAKMRIFVPLFNYCRAMEFSDQEFDQIDNLMSHIFFGLQSELLLDGSFQYGDRHTMKSYFSDADDAGFVCQPSALGAELFLWAFGAANKPMDYIFDPSFNCRVDGMPEVIPGARVVEDDDWNRFSQVGPNTNSAKTTADIFFSGRPPLGALEGRLQKHEYVKDVIVLQSNSAGSVDFMAYVVLQDKFAGIPSEQVVLSLREWMKSAFSEDLMPKKFIVMDYFPLTANGKLDRRALLDAAL